MKLRDFQEIIDHIHKSEENNTFRQKNRIRKEETQNWIMNLLRMIDKAMEQIYIDLKKENLTEQEIENVSYNMLGGIDDIFREYLQRISESMALGGFSHMYNSYKQLYYNIEEVIEIYEKVKDEKLPKKFKITKSVKNNKENVVREILNNYREITDDISEDDKRLVIEYINSLQFRQFLKEEIDEEELKQIKYMSNFIGNERKNFINFFKEQKDSVEENTKKAYVQSIIVIANILDQFRLLSQYQQDYKAELEEIELGELGYEVQGTEKELGIKEIFKEENLSKLPIKTLMALSAFWCNRLTKEMEKINNAKFICRDLDLVNNMVKFRIEETDSKELLANNDVIEREIEKLSFLNIITDKIINKIERDIKINGRSEEIDIESYIKEESAEYQDEYLEYFNKTLPNCNNILGDDIEQIIVAKNIINNLYKGKGAINFALLEEALITEKILNWGYIQDEDNEKFVLIGFDVENLSGPLFLHMPLKEIKDFLERNKLENKIPIYQGKEDFEVNGKTISRKLLMPIDNGKIKKLQEFKINQLEEIDKFHFIEHCKYIASGDARKYPKHLKKVKYIGKGKKQKQKLVIEKEYIDLETKEKYQKDKNGDFERIEGYTR